MNPANRIHLTVVSNAEPPPPAEHPFMPRDPKRMTMREAVAIAGALGHPSKMPGYSYGISATKCQTGGKLRKVRGSVCSGCYAMTDWYRTWRPLLAGHDRRWKGLRHPLWIDAMVRMIASSCVDPDNYFRWHDSGDLQGVWHLENIAEVCRRTPAVIHWLPTREYQTVATFLERHTLPDNLTVRLSAHMIDQEPVFDELAPVLAGLPVSTVATASLVGSGFQIVEGKGSIECRAVEARDNKCGPCRACWSRSVVNVTYPQH